LVLGDSLTKIRVVPHLEGSDVRDCTFAFGGKTFGDR
jgi:hypothetical protein